MRSGTSTESFLLESQKRLFRLAFLGLFFAVLTLALGCGKNPYAAGYADVSGKVIFDGKPLPGGQVSFVAVNGALAARGTIEEDGHYQIKAPIGEVQIGVNNRMFAVPSTKGRRPTGMIHPTKDGPIKDEDKPLLKGRWVNLPPAYSDPAISGLKYTVTPGSQTHDIELPKTPPTPPGASPP